MIQTGEREEVLDITVRPDRIESLAQILVGGGRDPLHIEGGGGRLAIKSGEEE